MIHESERKAFQRGAEAMRRACMAEFNLNAALLRRQQDNTPKEKWSMPRDLRLSAEISDQELAAYTILHLPVPAYEEEKTKDE